MTNNLLKAILH